MRADIKGLDALIKEYGGLAAQLQKEVSGVLRKGAQLFERGAKRDVAVNFGSSGLAGSIGWRELDPLHFEDFASRHYAPYIEWGTITRVSVPNDLKAYAIQFKGRGIRKTGGMYPRPFFFKQALIVKPIIERDLRAIKGVK